MNVTLHLGTSVLTVPNSALNQPKPLVSKEESDNYFKTGESNSKSKKKSKELQLRLLFCIVKLSKTSGGSTAAETLSLGLHGQSSAQSSSSFKNGGFVVALGSTKGNTISSFDENNKIKPIELELQFLWFVRHADFEHFNHQKNVSIFVHNHLIHLRNDFINLYVNVLIIWILYLKHLYDVITIIRGLLYLIN